MADGMTYVPDNSWGGAGNGFVWAFLIFALLGFGGGAFRGGNPMGGYQPQYATQQDVQTSSMFGQMLDGNRDIVNQMGQTKYDIISAVKDSQLGLQKDIANVGALGQAIQNNSQQCCTAIRQDIAGAKYDALKDKGELMQAIASEGQKTRDMIQQNKIEALQQQVNQLQQQLGMQGVVKYPMASTYNVGMSPFCNSGCGCMG